MIAEKVRFTMNEQIKHAIDHPFYDETRFHYILRIERMRAARSKKPCRLLLFDISKLMIKHDQAESAARIKSALIPAIRECDIRGWYRNCHVIGIIFTEVITGQDAFVDLIVHKIQDRFRNSIDPDWLNKIGISFYLSSENKSICLVNAWISSNMLISEASATLEPNDLTEMSVRAMNDYKE